MQKEATQSQKQLGRVRTLYRNFGTWDKKIQLMTRGIARLFRHGTNMYYFRKFAEPAVSGFAISIVLFAVDLFNGHGQTIPHLAHFATATVEHAKPTALWLATFVAGLALTIEGAFLSRFLLEIIAAPIFRLTHHATMVALGSFAALASREMSMRDGVFDTAIFTTMAVFVLLTLGIVPYLMNIYIEIKLFRRLERYRSFRLILTLGGIFFCTISVISLRELI